MVNFFGIRLGIMIPGYECGEPASAGFLPSRPRAEVVCRRVCVHHSEAERGRSGCHG